MLFFPEFVQSMIVALMVAVPTCVIYQRAGFNPLWAAMLFIPVFGVFFVVFHLGWFPWPNQQHQQTEE